MACLWRAGWHLLLNLQKDFRVFAVLSDGECDEGSTWEAILLQVIINWIT